MDVVALQTFLREQERPVKLWDVSTAEPVTPGLLPLPSDTQVRFLADPHVYVDVTDARRTSAMISVTKLLKVFFSDFDPDAVSHQLACKLPLKDYPGCYDAADIRQTWARRRDLGTALHANIEQFWNGMIQGQGVFDWEHELKLDPENVVPFAQFLRFWESRAFRKWHPVRAEGTVYLPDYGLAGQFDALAQRPDGTYILFDWKRVPKLFPLAFQNACGTGPCAAVPDCRYWQYALQLSLYAEMLERNAGVTVSHTRILQMHPVFGNEDAALHLMPRQRDTANAMLSMLAEARDGMNAAADAATDVPHAMGGINSKCKEPHGTSLGIHDHQSGS